MSAVRGALVEAPSRHIDWRSRAEVVSIGCARRVALGGAHLGAQVARRLAAQRLRTGAGGTISPRGDCHGFTLEDVVPFEHGLETNDCRRRRTTCQGSSGCAATLGGLLSLLLAGADPRVVVDHLTEGLFLASCGVQPICVVLVGVVCVLEVSDAISVPVQLLRSLRCASMCLRGRVLLLIGLLAVLL